MAHANRKNPRESIRLPDYWSAPGGRHRIHCGKEAWASSATVPPGPFGELILLYTFSFFHEDDRDRAQLMYIGSMNTPSELVQMARSLFLTDSSKSWGVLPTGLRRQVEGYR